MIAVPSWLLAAMAAALCLAVGGAALPRCRRPAATRPARSSPTRSSPTLRRRRRERVLDTVWPDALELFVVAVQAGHPPLAAMHRLVPSVHPVVAAAFAEVCARVDRGERFADAMHLLPAMLGMRALTLVATVAQAERTGQPLGPLVDRLADDARQHRRRRAEAEIRELPVRLAFPLVLCTLPSFVLVAIAPVLIGALSSLGHP